MIHPNLYKYKVAPSPKLVQEIVQKSGLKRAQFERVHGLYKDAIKQAINQTAKIPTKHWHLFYEPSKKRRKNRSKSALRIAPTFHPETNSSTTAKTILLPKSDSEELGSLIDKLTG